MTCKCGSDRIMHLYGKCNDLANLTIPHLKIDHDGYLPELGTGMFGDEFSFSVCMDCGQIQHWTPISDETVLADESVSEKILEQIEAEEAEEERKQARRYSDKSPDVITLTHLVKTSKDNCPLCKQPWSIHDHSQSTPICP